MELTKQLHAHFPHYKISIKSYHIKGARSYKVN